MVYTIEIFISLALIYIVRYFNSTHSCKNKNHYKKTYINHKKWNDQCSVKGAEFPSPIIYCQPRDLQSLTRKSTLEIWNTTIGLSLFHHQQWHQIKLCKVSIDVENFSQLCTQRQKPSPPIQNAMSFDQLWLKFVDFSNMTFAAVCLHIWGDYLHSLLAVRHQGWVPMICRVAMRGLGIH